jgi:hypothetical protein
MLITQLLVGKNNMMFVWMRWRTDATRGDGLWHTNLHRFRIGDVQSAIQHFTGKFLEHTGNEWKHVDEFVRQPGRDCFMGYAPIEIPCEYYELIKVSAETRTPPEPWNEVLSKERIRHTQAQRLGLVTPAHIFPTEAKSAIDASDRARSDRADEQLSILIARVPVLDKRSSDSYELNSSAKRVKR